MKKILATSAAVMVIATGCTTEVATSGLDYIKKGDNYTLDAQVEATDTYQNFTKELDQVGDLTSDSRVCTLTTSIANMMSDLGANLVGVTESDSLNQQLQDKLESEEIANIGSVLSPNLEVLTTADCDVTFIANSMPHTDVYDQVDNLVFVPQTTYTDVYTTLYGLEEKMGLDTAKTTLSNMIKTDLAAKQEYDNAISSEVAVIQYTMGHMYISDENSFVGSMIAELGIKNAFADYPDSTMELSYEELIGKNPEYIVIYGHGMDEKSLEEFMKDERLQSLDAVKNNKVITLPEISSSADLSAADTLKYVVEQIKDVSEN